MANWRGVSWLFHYSGVVPNPCRFLSVGHVRRLGTRSDFVTEFPAIIAFRNGRFDIVPG
jgi:hypothetical protein